MTKKLFTLVLTVALIQASLWAQDWVLPTDTTVVTNHTTTINGVKISYTATTGTQPRYGTCGW